MACAAGQTEVAKILIESNASVNPAILIDPLNSPLHEAVMKGVLSHAENMAHFKTHFCFVFKRSCGMCETSDI